MRPRTLNESSARLQHRGDESRYFRAANVEPMKFKSRREAKGLCKSLSGNIKQDYKVFGA